MQSERSAQPASHAGGKSNAGEDRAAGEAQAVQKISNRLMKRLGDILGLTTGIGVVAWGGWSLITTVVLTIYERSGLTAAEIHIEDAFNQGLLQSAMLIALGAIILELRRIADLLSSDAANG